MINDEFGCDKYINLIVNHTLNKDLNNFSKKWFTTHNDLLLIF